MTDIFWFFALLFTCLAVFAVLHVIGLRRHQPARLMLYLMGNYAVSAGLASVFCYWAYGHQFSSPACYAVANTGAVIAGFFAAAFYIFLGPATADRSLTAHLLVYLRRSENGACTDEDILGGFSPGAFLQKRYRECTRAGLIEHRDGVLKLSARGRYLAAFYALLLKALALGKRSEFQFSFPADRP